MLTPRLFLFVGITLLGMAVWLTVTESRSLEGELDRLDELITRFENMVPQELVDDSTLARPQWQEEFLSRARELRTMAEQRRSGVRSAGDPTVWGFAIGVIMLLIGIIWSVGRKLSST